MNHNYYAHGSAPGYGAGPQYLNKGSISGHPLGYGIDR